MSDNEKAFDLNIEKILENWEIYHALREIISNALDEQILTNTSDIEIYKTRENFWHIRDYGRGLHYKHLTQKENDEKLNHENLIGQFGIGLKDALATLNRNGIEVFIKSRYLSIEKLSLVSKVGFDDVDTLHAIIKDSSEPNFEGTEFILRGIKDEDIEKAKKLFLKFSDSRILTTNKYGQIIETNADIANIYLNGVKVAEEENFLFSYNITSLDQKIKKTLNRERTNVGRTAYSERIKSIIKKCTDLKILERFGYKFQNLSSGEAPEEVTWIDIQQHILKYLNSDDYIYITSEESLSYKNIVNEAESSGKEIIFIPENLRNKVQGMTDISGNLINDLSNYIKERTSNFTYEFVNPKNLNKEELIIFNKTEEIFQLIGGKPKNIKDIKISETMQNDIHSFLPAAGIWNPETNEIFIKRTELKSIKTYAGVLLHEALHAKSGHEDVTREFEIVLTNVIGLIVSKIIN